MCSEVFFMMMISVIFHAFAFLHKQIDELLGNPDSIFNVAGTPSDENCQVHLVINIVIKSQNSAKFHKMLPYLISYIMQNSMLNNSIFRRIPVDKIPYSLLFCFPVKLLC